MSRTITVAGATGTVGPPLVARLAAAGASVRALTRAPGARPAPAGARWVDAASPDAFSGADAAFLLSPPGLSDQEAVLAPLIDAARAGSRPRGSTGRCFGRTGSPRTSRASGCTTSWRAA